jgi:hypothetical protein
MTPDKWERCTDERAMVRFLLRKAGDRQLRLLACACARRLWGLLEDKRSKVAVEVAEHYADGRTSEEQLLAALAPARAVEKEEARGARSEFEWPAAAWAARVAALAAVPDGYNRHPARWILADAAIRAEVGAVGPAAPEARFRAAKAALVGLMRCIAGNPFQPLPALAPAVLAHNGGAARRMAEAIYDGRRFGDLAVLADLLEEAGCTDAALLGHLRGPGPHVLGCWVLDAVLGRT